MSLRERAGGGGGGEGEGGREGLNVQNSDTVYHYPFWSEVSHPEFGLAFPHPSCSQARQLLQDYEEAIVDFQEVQKIEPTNKAAKAQIIASRNKLKSQREREKKRFANMFDKFAAEDTRFVFHPAVAWPPRGTGVQGLCFTQL